MERHRVDIDRAVVHIVTTERSDGSFALDVEPMLLDDRRSTICDEPWLPLRQVHGTTIVDAGRLVGQSRSVAAVPPLADGAVTFDDACAVSVLTADCAPVVLIGSNGVAVVHAGWRGAADGVIGAAARQLTAGGARPVASVLGPCIQPRAYEFGAEDLKPIVAEFGDAVVSRTASGADALDLTRVVQIACERAGWPQPERPQCTSDRRFFSHRSRGDVGRQATVAWIEMQ